MPSLPSGTVTFLFTDIEGSTKLWEQHPQAMSLALARHDALLRQAIEANNGVVFKTVGDAFCAAFATAPDALRAAVASHLFLLNEEWGETGALRVRMGLHTGEAHEREGDYFGPTLNRVARLQSIGHGQQTLLSHTTYPLVCHSLPADVTLLDMGQHLLKDLLAPEQVWQVRHGALSLEFPPLRSLNSLPTNLPRQMTSFIGRDQDMAEVKRLLFSTPLLTLVGSGGVGKTRLALQVGAEVLDHYKDGVWLVELAALSDPNLVPQAVATVLGLREEAGRSLLQNLQAHLRERQLLLLLDNCEHLLDACAFLADTLLKNCPHITILATSREPLCIAGEQSWRVPSLLTPAPAELPREEKNARGALMEYDACRLFVERAVVARQGFVLTRRNVPVVARLCQQLDGIPLAIELAAARVRSLSVEEITGKLDNRFRLLTGGNRTALPRHQTLSALVDWSYDLLNRQEKTLLCRLAVFSGGWTLAAAEQVGGGEVGEDIEAWEVVDLLTSLVDKSLVLAQTHNESTRYRLLETVRQYAYGRLVESGESLVVRGQHSGYFLTLAEEVRPKLQGAEEAQWLEVLEEEHDNLRQALTFYAEDTHSDTEAGEKGLRLGAALRNFWQIRGHLSEGRESLRVLLAHPGGQEPTKARADALYSAAVLTSIQGDYAAARSLLEESLTLYRTLGNQRGIANSLIHLGNMDLAQGDYTAARRLYEESLSIQRASGNRGGIATSLVNLGNVACEQGDYAAAQSLLEESLSIHRALGNRGGTAISLNNLGDVAFIQGDYAAARRLYEESLNIQCAVGNRHGIAYGLEAFASLALKVTQEERCVRLWGAAAALRETIGSLLPPVYREKQEREAASVRKTVGEDAFALAWADGQVMLMEQAIEYALEKCD